MDKQEASRLISEKVDQAMVLLKEAQDLADANGVVFDFNPAYGMGGTYFPAKRDGVERDEWYNSNDEGGWQSSSHNC